MTTKADFEADEWALIVRTPRWVVAGASAAQRDIGFRTDREIEAGYIATAKGHSDNPFVTAVATETMMIFDSRDVVGAGDQATLASLSSTNATDREAGLAAVLEQVAAVTRLMASKAEPADAKAYRRWLVEITDVVITAARSNDILGFGGQIVTTSEQRFRDRLVLTLQQ
jgi:hypothetical protein